MWDLSSLTRDQTWASSSGSIESEPLDHYGIPCIFCLKISIVYTQAIELAVERTTEQFSHLPHGVAVGIK